MKKIGVLTSGGDAPGMNAALRGVVRAAYHYGLSVAGIFRGYQGLIENDIEDLAIRSVNHILGNGGTKIKSARSQDFMTVEGRKKAYEHLMAHEIDGLVVIGGDGTFTGADIFNQEHNFPIIGVPGTIDNDLFGTDFTIGYDTSTNTVVEAVDKIRDTAHSHNRLFFIEVMGKHAGFIALRTGVATGAIEIMMPETSISTDELISTLEQGRINKKTSSIVIVAEGNQNGGAMELAEKVKEKYSYYDTRVSVLGHLQRGGSPSCADRILASELGVASVEALIDGKRDLMVGMVSHDISYIPFKDAIGKKKKMDNNLIRISKILSI